MLDVDLRDKNSLNINLHCLCSNQIVLITTFVAKRTQLQLFYNPSALATSIKFLGGTEFNKQEQNGLFCSKLHGIKVIGDK